MKAWKFLDSRGVFQIPLLMILWVWVIAGFGIWGFFRNARFLVETQLRLDRCVGQVALHFKKTLESLESSNQKIQSLRAEIRIAELEPWLIPPLEIALGAVAFHQGVLQAAWSSRWGAWLLSKGCGEREDRALALPLLKYIRDPPDLIGLQPLKWVGVLPREFYFHVKNGSRHAAACVAEAREKGENRYEAFWCPPRRSSWTSFD